MPRRVRVETPKGYKFVAMKRPTKADFEVTHVEVDYIIGPRKLKAKAADGTFDASHNGAFGLKWGTKGAGFGTVSFAMVNGKIECQNEMMSKEFVKEVLAKMVDDAIFTESDLPR